MKRILTAYDWANVKEVEPEQSGNSRRRMFVATAADGEEHHLIIWWPRAGGRHETIHCFDCRSMNNCDGAFRLHLCLIDEELRDGKRKLREMRQEVSTLALVSDR